MATVPYTFATMPAGNVPAADIDANFAALPGITGSPSNGDLIMAAASANNFQDSGISQGAVQGMSAAGYLPFTCQIV